jgi:signal transduction histidine kinase
MLEAFRVPASGRGPTRVTVAAIAAAALALSATTIAFGVANSVDPDQIALLQWLGLPYVFAGLVAWWRRPDSRLGPLMIACGLVAQLTALQFADLSLPFTLGAVLDIVPAAIFLHAYLAFPDGRLRSTFERVLVVSAYVAAIGLQAARMSLGSFDNALEVTSRPHLALALGRIELLSVSALMLAGIAVLLLRRRRAGRPRRRSVALVIDLFALGLLLAAALFVVAVLEWPGFRLLQRATWIVVGLAPVVFLAGLLDARLARSAVGDLVVKLRTDLAPTELQDALARALRDPSLTLAYWLPDFGAYVDLDGRPVDVPGDDGRVATTIDRNGSRVAALVHDAALRDEPELLDAVSATAGIALENARLQAELAARLEEVKESRARVLDAGQKERQRLERDLHDGAQQRLVALSLELRLLERQLGHDSATQERLGEVQREVARSLEELRDLARGLHPAVLTGHGLAVALEQVVARAPVPVRLSVDVDGRLREPVEVAAYYVVTESLANVAKHARATAATVTARLAGETLTVEITDDGVGGADGARGSGLRGLADRVEALGGRLVVSTARGGGTRVHAEIPCG